ncbi:shikimate dehydrogenase [Aliidiomarina taiwanensis]|uniref:Shikimate dehydrogenase (NADP(+)) n=1 Tax=Aliidiomarina taiwanensis TaxID=946228 RepID=A0A432X8D2_9GAMM|nr:shikimate dehydrogenase [Aliidiomarina taiwanensis]RUO43663.1 shikimate dehydrogenase [Aliidiomarina taiwanensis]
MKLAVFGSPIRHSLSPDIHTAFAEQFGLAVQYTRIEATAEQFETRFAAFEKAGGIGANITLPLKEYAFTYADSRSSIASQTGAVNTLVKQGQDWFGTNTDGVGLVADLQSLETDLAGARVLLLGAGGAARGVIPALTNAGVQYLHVANRTEQRANQLVQHARKHATSSTIEFAFSRIEDIPNMGFQVIVNATSSGLQGQRLPIPSAVFANTPFCYDMVYGAQPTLFLQAALASHCQVADGLGMLVGQAAESFRLWTGKTPETGSVLTRLRNQHKLWSRT